MRKMVAKRMSARDWLDRDSVRKFEWIIGLDEVRFPVMGHIKDVLTIPSCLLVPSEKNKASPEEFIWILSLLDLVLTSDYMLFENLKKDGELLNIVKIIIFIKGAECICQKNL